MQDRAEPIDESTVHEALAFFVRIEPEPESIDSVEEWRAAMAPYAAEIEERRGVIRRYAEEIQPADLHQMREAFFKFVHDEAYDRPVARSVVMSVIQQAWHEVGPWRR